LLINDINMQLSAPHDMHNYTILYVNSTGYMNALPAGTYMYVHVHVVNIQCHKLYTGEGRGGGTQAVN
jgi:hypothetical protein